jgi:hypothetical protein
MTESSFFFTAGEFCSSVSEHRDHLTEPPHLLQFQVYIEERLNDWTDHQYNSEGQGKTLTVRSVIRS